MAVDKNDHLKDDWLSLFLFIAPLVCFHSFRKKRNAFLVDSEKSDEYYLQKAHQLRLNLDKPKQSRFRVVALIVLNDGTVIPGTNDEPSPTITGALCAERAAFLQLRLVLLEKKKQHQQHQRQQQQLQVEKVYIVTDASIPVPPGMLCREYMYGHDAVRPDHTLYILQSADSTSQPLILTLCDLYPYHPFYIRLTVEEITAKGQELSLAAKALTSSSHASQIANMIAHPSIVDISNILVENNVVPRLFAAATKALELDNRDMVHLLRFGAAAAILRKRGNDNDDAIVEIVHAGQRKAAEYGASLDAVCQLAASFQEHENDTVLMIVQLDQYGILHPPFGIARTFLVEHGHGDCVCLFMRERIIADNDKTIQSHDDKQETLPLSSPRLELVAVPAKELAPFPPEFR